MKKITLLFSLLLTFSGFSQNFLDFSDAAYFEEGTTVFSFGGSTGSVVSINGNNVYRVDGGTQDYDGVLIILPSSVNLSDNNNNTVTFDFTVTEVGSSGQHFLQFKNSDDINSTFLPFTAPTAVGTYSINIDFPADLTTYSQIGLYTDGNFDDAVITTSSIYYWDNFSVGPTLYTKDISRVKFSTFPNPTKNSWTIKTQNSQMTAINVYDVLGKRVISIAPNNNQAEIDASSLDTGLYFARITTLNGNESSLRLIKN